jgi:hypothetical protein
MLNQLDAFALMHIFLLPPVLFIEYTQRHLREETVLSSFVYPNSTFSLEQKLRPLAKLTAAAP